MGERGKEREREGLKGRSRHYTLGIRPYTSDRKLHLLGSFELSGPAPRRSLRRLQLALRLLQFVLFSPAAPRSSACRSSSVELKTLQKT